MSFYATLTLTASVVNFLHAVFVLRKNPGGRINVTWALATMCIVVAGLGEFVMRVTTDAATADIINRISAIGFRFLPSFVLHFALVFSGRDHIIARPHVLLLVYIPAFIFSLFQVSGAISVPKPVPWGFEATPAEGFIPYIIWLEGCFGAGLFLIYQKMRRADSDRARRQAMLVFFGILLPLLPGSFVDAVLPLLDIETYRIALFGSTVTISFVSYSVARYQFMSLTPQSTADNIIRTIGDLLVVTDSEGRIVFTNDAFREIVWQKKNATGVHVREIFTQADELLQQASALPPRSGKSLSRETEYRTRTGRLHPAIISLSQVRDGNASIGFVLLARDITERKRVEEFIRHNEMQLAEAQKIARMGRWEWDIAQDKVTWSEELFHIFGLQPWQAKLTYDGFLERIHEDDRATVDRVVRQALVTGESFSFDARLLKPDDSIRYLHGKGNVVVDKSTEKPTRMVGIAMDTTERTVAEQSIRMLAQTITSINECVCITDLQNRIIFVNPAFLRTYGYEEHEVVGRPVTILRPLTLPADLGEEIARHTREAGWRGELRNVRQSGEEFPILLSTSAIRDKDGTVVALVGISRDISEQKLLERQLEEAMRRRSEDMQRFALFIQEAQEEERRRIARELHDDLGQRLSGMKLNLEVVEDSPDTVESRRSVREMLEAMKRQIDSMIAEIRRISSNLHPSALDDFGLMAALQLLVKEFQRGNRIEVRLDIAETDIDIRFDQHIELALYRITQESFSNIARHSGAKNICLHLSSTDSHVSLKIEDDGRGFDPRSLRLEKHSSRGLGLISMRERAEHLGGSFSITSEPGHGTTVRVGIPREQSRGQSMEKL